MITKEDTMKIAIVTDSSAEISLQEEKEIGIRVIRMPLTVDGEVFVEARDITREDLIQAMLDGKSVGTSQPNLQFTQEVFEGLLKDYDHIIYLPISQHLSGTYSSAAVLMHELEDKLTIIDTRFVSWPLKIMALQAKQMVEDGMSPHEIQEILERDSFMYASLIPEDIQYLKRGGRITSAAAAAANLLKIIPVLKVTEGRIDLSEKVRTHKKALNFGIEKVVSLGNFDEYEWCVLNGGYDQDKIEEIAVNLENVTGQPVVRGELHAIVLAHTGPGTIGIVAVKKVGK